MEIYVARQPILNKRQEIIAYELLYRNSEKNIAFPVPGEQATSDVMNSILQMGFEELADGKDCYINCTEKFLEQSIPSYLPAGKTVIEVLETVEITERVVQNCRRLKAAGYRIALDDFVLRENNHHVRELLTFVDIVKIDIRQTPRSEQLRIIDKLKAFHLIFLAEKVETREEYLQCLEDGYSYFQGYFFSKPVMLSAGDVPIQNYSLLLVMGELAKQDPDINYLANVIERDISLSYKLLKLINSVLLRPAPIKTIKQAIVFLGIIELKKWMFVLSFQDHVGKEYIGTNEIVKMSFIRARAAESIAIEQGHRMKAPSYFLIGLLSLIDALMKRPLEAVLAQMPLDKEIQATILGDETEYKAIFDLVKGMERANWNEIGELCHKINIDEGTALNVYRKAVLWTNQLLGKNT